MLNKGLRRFCLVAPRRLRLPENAIRPKYPKDALRKNVGGNVELRAVIAPDGKTTELTILEGEPEFSKNALDAVRRWRFQPISKQGNPVETVYRVHIRFNPLLREANGDAELVSPKVPEPTSVLPLAEHSAEGEVHRISEPQMVPPKPIYQPEPEFSEASRKKTGAGKCTDWLGGRYRRVTTGLEADLQFSSGFESECD